MRPLVIGACALGVWAAAAADVSAAWNNVFQPTCFFGRHRRTTTNFVAAPVVAHAAPAAACCPTPAPAPACPQQQCSTSYSQRCYYQPVTTYQTQTYYEPVTTYKTNYYYEPVTSYRYSCYYDPCTCSYQQVAVPTTSYQLRSQNCPVQSWVQRCCSVPVTTYQKSCYWVPQTTCCTTTEGAPIPAANGNGNGHGMAVVPGVAAPPAVAVQPGVAAPPQVTTTPQFGVNPGIPNPPPNVSESRSGPPPVINEHRNGGTNYERTYPLPQQTTPGTSFRPPAAQPRQPSPPPPPVKLDRIVFGPDATVEGQVVRGDNSPRPHSRVRFVGADRQGPDREVFANSAGRFQTTLAPGGWLVFLTAPDGTQVFHSRIDVAAHRNPAPITLVNR